MSSAAALQPVAPAGHVPVSAGVMPSRASVLQRACACGGRAGLTGKCDACDRHERLGRPALQASLTVGASDDAYEREADRVAGEVMRMPEASTHTPLVTPLPRVGGAGPDGTAQCKAGANTALPVPSGFTSGLNSVGSGSPLPPQARHFFEPRFNRDLGHVRVHDGPIPGALARDVGARAFTIGSEIYFAPGHYDSESVTGRHLLAHELTHVIQQRGASSSHEGSGAGPDTPDTAASLHRGRDRTVIQRSIFSDARKWAIDQLVSPETQAFLSDLYASIVGAPQEAPAILGEVWDAIRTHWVAFSATLLAFLGAEAAVGALTAAPEPTFLTKLLAFILQALIFAALGYFATVEVGQVMTHAVAWWRSVGSAHGDPGRIVESSRSFCRMLLHIALLVLTVVGARARFRTPAAPAEAAAASAEGAVRGAAAPPAAPTGPPALRLIPGGGGARHPGATAGPSFDGSAARALALETAPVPSAPPLRLVPEPAPAPPPAPAAAAAPAAAGAASPAAVTGSAAAAATSAALTSSSATSCPPLPPGVQVRLELPSQKAVHQDIYNAMILGRQLQHRVARPRATNQLRRWDEMMMGGGMPRSVYERGERMGLCNRQILRPSWTAQRLWPDTQVDHVIEYQLSPIGREASIDQPWNYELLDQASNASSGSTLQGNIAAERARLVAVTGNPAWSACDLTFTTLVVASQANAGRWSLSEVEDGRHLAAFTHLGLAPEDVCP